MMMMVNDEWVRAAMTDDTVVVNLLLRLKNSLSPDNYQPLPLTWGLRQPRSRPRLTPASRCCYGAVSTRCSPTTPLSWSGGASPSATADGYEDSSRHHAARSKATVTSEYTGNSTSTKKCRRKKTFAELKEEESSLLKERTYLKKEIEHVNANFEAQRAKNESLKRMKLDIGSKSHNNPSSKSDEQQCPHFGQPHKKMPPSLRALTHATNQVETQSQVSQSRPSEIESSGGALFLIPDLNMMPAEDNSFTDAVCGSMS